MISTIAISEQLTLSYKSLGIVSDKKRSYNCLPQDQFKENDRDNHIGARTWHNQPVDLVGSLWLPVLHSKRDGGLL